MKNIYYGQQHSRHKFSLLLMLWGKKCQKTKEIGYRWLKWTDTLYVHTPLCSLLQCSAYKVIMFGWITDFRTDKQERKTHHTHSVIPYISQLWYKRERRLFNYSHWGGGGGEQEHNNNFDIFRLASIASRWPWHFGVDCLRVFLQ